MMYICEHCKMGFDRRRTSKGYRFCSQRCHGLSKREAYDFKKQGECLVCVNHKNTTSFGHVLYERNGIRTSLHRHVYEEMFGEIPAKLQVRHTCDNPPCCNPEHLILGTIADNMRDKMERGRQAKGERVGGAKLNESKVREIRAATGTNRAIGIRFGMSESSIGYIRRRLHWRHVI